MKEKVTTLVLIIMVGVFVGLVALKNNGGGKTALKAIFDEQSKILQMQTRMDAKLGDIEGSISKNSGMGTSDMAGMLATQISLQQKLALLESKISDIEKALKAGGGAQAPERQAPPPEDYTTVYEIPVAHSKIVGSKSAKITITEFVDFECPFCARFHTPVNEVVAKYPGKVNYMIKNFPLGFHKNARTAVKAAFAAGEQGKYAEMVDLLLENGRSLGEDKYKELASQLGLDVDKFLKDYQEKDAQWEDYINQDIALGSKIGVRGTPTFYINGRKTAARDLAGYEAEINKILSGQ
ncbi:MAG: DsbA family protein [Candidatus Omnitrophica bacterium]|nr:DsbA family protein [Candidatus Omnitrophota bacterium]MBU1997740.1 DsbA family protein [Candidatus Omnitrophota bacterium]MBU4333653.1 DsbA family protein [Candidatus Omnitrophota bacterium]